MGNKRRNDSDKSSSESSASSSEEDKIQTNKRQLDSESSSDEDEEWNERNSSSKRKQTKIRKPQRKVSKPTVKESDNESPEEDEKEEGEVEDDDEFNDGYDENLMGDEEDQKRLLNMTEKEREQELFNRSEKREVLKTRFEIEKKLRLAKKKEQNKSIPFTDTQLRSTDRRKALENNRKQKDGLKQLKEQREKRKQKAKLRASDVYSSSDDSDNEHNQRRKSSSSSSSSSSSDESSSDERRKSDDDSKAEIEEIPFDLDYKVLNSIRLSRYKMSQWCHNPFFKETIIGCFVRLSIGMNKDKTPVYRVAEIVDVIDGPKGYELEKTKTDKLLKLKHGRDERSFRIQYVSNTEFTEREFNDWRMKMEKERLNLPTKKQIDDKSKHIHAAVNYNFKESDIEAIVKEKEKYIDIPHNFAMKKTQLKKEKDMAEQRGDLNKVEQLSVQLEEIEEKAKELDYKRTQNISAISYINERNRMRNIVEAEKAIVLAREQDKLNKGDEPFKRRKCAPILVSMTKNKLNINSNPDKSNESKDEVDKVVVPNGTPINSKSSMKDSETSKSTSIEPEQNDLFSAHDFDIQIDFDITSNLTSSSQNSNSLYASNLTCSSIASNKSTNRRSLNLEEYKKKKGLI